MKRIYLLDTCIISEPTRPVPDEHIISKLKTHEGRMALPAVVWHELLYGVNRLPEGKRKDQLFRYLTELVAPWFPVIPYDEHAAWIHGRIRADREKTGRTRPFADEQIAAMALANSMILVTRNTADFEGIPLLATENWFG